MSHTSEALDLSVGGMTCAGCASSIQRGLALLPGVKEASVNVATRRATVLPDGSLDPQELDAMMRAAIEGLGYQVLTPAAVPAGGEASSGGSDSPLTALAKEHEAQRAADASRAADLRRRLVVSAALSVPVVALSMVPALQFGGWQAWAALLSAPVVFWGARPFHRSAWMAAKHKTTTMDTLVSVGTLVAWLWSAWVLVSAGSMPASQMAGDTMGGLHVYFETAAVIVTLIVLGKWLEVRSSAKAGDAIRALSSRQSATATLEDGTVIDRDRLEVGMRCLVRPGEVIPTDGTVVEGESAVDAALVTGESQPVWVREGSQVVGGALAVDGSFVFEVTKVGSETMLAQIARLVDQAQQGKANVQRLADRIAAVFVPVVMVLAAGTGMAWMLATGDVDKAITAAVAVLIISCPCALGLATPLAILVGVGRGAQLGVLIRGPQVLEDTRKLTTVVLDKTGTLTEGKMTVAAVSSHGLDDASLATVLAAAASVEARSEHPIAAAIAAHGAAGGAERMPLKGFTSIPGRGASATVRGAGEGGGDADVTVGSATLFDAIPSELETWTAAQASAGATVVFVGRIPAVGDGLLGGSLSVVTRKPLEASVAIAVTDTVKPGAAEAVAELRRAGLEVLLVTGDQEGPAGAVAQAVGIDDVRSRVLPGDKAAVVTELQAQGRKVAMVGDGINDAPALAAADVGIAMGTGTDVAREASDLTVVSGDIAVLPMSISLARRTLGTIKGNLFWAFAYNVIAIPVAAAGLLDPMIAAAAMGASSLFVVGNSLRLRSARL
jgi:P-type Cu+ transporter